MSVRKIIGNGSSTQQPNISYSDISTLGLFSEDVQVSCGDWKPPPKQCGLWDKDPHFKHSSWHGYVLSKEYPSFNSPQHVLIQNKLQVLHSRNKNLSIQLVNILDYDIFL